MKRKVYFRADAGSHIGYGHFIRSLALADILKSHFDCVLVTQTPTLYQKEEVVKVCRLIELPTDDSKFNLFLDFLKGDEIVVLDNYFYTEDYKKQIKKKGCILVCIDDFCEIDNISDVIINYGVEDLQLFQVSGHTQLCSGLKWVLLRSPFLYAHKQITKSVRDTGHWVVCFGGSDENDFTSQVCEIMEKIPAIESITAIVGDGYKFQDKLICLKKVRIANKLSAEQMAELFLHAKYAILSASTIALEALACGVKVLSGYYVENQRNLYNTLKGHQYIVPLHDLTQLETDQLTIKIEESICNTTNLKELIVQDIPERYISLFSSWEKQNKKYFFIDYTQLAQEQHELVWQTRNLESIRKWMVNKNVFSFENHLAFVQSLLEATDKKYWAVFSNERVFVGSYSIINIQQKSCERGLFIVPEFAGKGVAGEIEAEADSILRKMNIEKIEAEVLKENQNSIRYHIKQGYKQIGEDDAFYYYERYLY